ncbi:RNA-binding domain-containing protein [Candidatus Neptunochlamydia vexilliferae]|uniref:RNA-binding domain-containing protein n=1 Tax=Candidatus Neptunichlamydia vexilliferae TaxID=1651774 RepID=UPI001891F108|nr:RNA-binding domain-containing protein [Candidatus Neptunochlamydia vexilliferae]
MKYLGNESSTLEFKKTVPENDQIIKTIIGFCNQSGGKLVIGVDRDGTVVGIPEEKVQEMMEYVNKSIFEASSPPIIPAVYSQRVGDKSILIIEVSSGMNKPYYRKSKGLEKGTYVRLSRSTVKATADMIEELKWKSRGRSFDMMPVYHGKNEDLDRAKILEFLSSRKASKVKTISRTILSSYNLVVEEHSSNYPTIGGVLLFGKNTQKFFSEAMILCTHFDGVSGRKAISSVDCTGTLFEQFDMAYNFIIGRLGRSFSIDGPKRKEELEIPETALREVLINAIVHRNYHINAPTKVAIYDNRIEVFSPGVFPGPLDANNLKMGITYIRNKVICKIFREAGYIEKLGSGFIALFESYEEKKLHPPEVIEGENFIKCILPRPSFSSKPHQGSSESQKILALFEMSDELTISDVMKLLNLSRPTAGRRLAELTEKGLLEKVGKNKATRYRKQKKSNL